MTNKKTSSGMVLVLLVLGFLSGGRASLSGEILITDNDASKPVVSAEIDTNTNALDYPIEETPLPLPAVDILKLPGLIKTPFGYDLTGQLWYPTNLPSIKDQLQSFPVPPLSYISELEQSRQQFHKRTSDFPPAYPDFHDQFRVEKFKMPDFSEFKPNLPKDALVPISKVPGNTKVK